MSFSADCPVCDAGVSLATDTVVDELMECDDCGCELVVSSLQPMALDEAPMAEEDWGE
jgi:alpha-aminoadipate carrier protein LysW